MTNKEAIEILSNRLNTYYCTDEDLQALDLAIKALEERPQGRWLPFNYDDEVVENVRDTVWDEVYAPRFKCSECGFDDFASTYCPNCGALMEDSEDKDYEP